MERTRLDFDVDGTACAGYLYRPAAAGAPLPCVVLAHGFGGTQDTPSIQAVAASFVQADLAVLSFDYRHFGESGGAPRQLIRIAGQHEDLRAALRCARARPEIDPRRIALWGTSLGGAHAVAVAADDPGVAAVVAQVPFNGTARKVEGRSAATTLRLLGAMAYDALRGALGLPPYYIPAVGGRGTVAVMASPQAEQAVAAMRSTHWRNEVAPRALFDLMRYKPSALAHRLAMPLLVCLAEHDREVPAELVRELAERAPRGELKSYPVTHFDFYRPEVRAQVIADQLGFLRRHLALSAA